MALGLLSMERSIKLTCYTDVRRAMPCAGLLCLYAMQTSIPELPSYGLIGPQSEPTGGFAHGLGLMLEPMYVPLNPNDCIVSLGSTMCCNPRQPGN